MRRTDRESTHFSPELHKNAEGMTWDAALTQRTKRPNVAPLNRSSDTQSQLPPLRLSSRATSHWQRHLRKRPTCLSVSLSLSLSHTHTHTQTHTDTHTQTHTIWLITRHANNSPHYEIVFFFFVWIPRILAKGVLKNNNKKAQTK